MTETWFSMSNNVLSVLRLQGSNLPLDESFWSNDDLKDPKKLYEMTVLLNAQREIAEKILDDQWETRWRQNKVGHFGCFPEHIYIFDCTRASQIFFTIHDISFFLFLHVQIAAIAN